MQIHKKLFLNRKIKLSYLDTYLFFENLYELTKSGIPLLKSFEIINFKDEKILKIIRDNLNKGMSLSAALDDTKLFNPSTIAIIQSGELTGNLELCFEKLYRYYEKMNETKKSLQSSLFYPIILVFSIFFLLFFINFYFIPQIINMYDFDTNNMSFIAQILISFSTFSNNYKIETLIFLLSFILLTSLLLNEIYIKKDENLILFKIPILSKLTKDYTISNILWTYFLMLSSGIDIVNATIIINNQSKNRLVKQKLSSLLEEIEKGNSITCSITSAKITEKNILYFIKVAEESGNIDNNLKILSDMYYKNLTIDIKYITQIIQPFLILIITFIVGVLIIGIVLPMLDYSRFI